MVAAILVAYALGSIAIPVVWDRRHRPQRVASTTGTMRRRARS